MSAAPDAHAFVLKLGRSLHAFGYPAHRLEDALLRVSSRLGLIGHFFSTPTALFASFGDETAQQSFQIRIEPGSLDLRKLALLEQLADDVAGGLPPATASRRVDEIVAAAPPYGALACTVAFALGSAAASRFFDSGWRELVVSGVIGLGIGLLALLVGRVPGLGRVFEALAAVLAATVASIAAHQAPLSVYVATLAGLIVLMPGFPLTTALTEIGTRNLMSGTARLAGAASTFIVLGFGVALGNRVVELLLGPTPNVEPAGLPGWTLWVALVVSPICFTILLQAERRDAPFIVIAGLVAFGAARGGSSLLGPELGACLGAMAVGVYANAYARVLRRPAAIPLVPGILLLVPGSLGFRSLSWLLDRETVPGVEAAFRMLLVAVSLATGLLLSNVILAERKATRRPGTQATS
jgi:uncharacterized membrane protein YjjP (DUF1212 family)